MKLAISNIAWESSEDNLIAKKLKELGIKFIEIAPSKYWNNLEKVTDLEITDCLSFWNSYGIEIVAFQSMLFNRPDLLIFASDGNRKRTSNYLKASINLASRMGAKRLVFGSPKNRLKGTLDEHNAIEISKKFFAEIGDVANQNGVIFCIEPNPEAYGCDFITNTNQGIKLVKEVNNNGFGLHLDLAGMTLAKENIKDCIINAQDVLKHFHISTPFLSEVNNNNQVNYKDAADALNEIGYNGYVSIEMRSSDSGDNLMRVENAIKFSQSIYNS